MAQMRSLSFSRFCETLGVPLRNIRWSWSAHAPARRLAMFTIWSDKIVGTRYVFWTPAYSELPKHGGRTELCDNFNAAADAGHTAFGIVCDAVDEDESPRQRKSFDRERLLLLHLTREGDELVAYVQGEVNPEVLAAGGSLVISSPSWAIDDLAAPPLGVTTPQQVQRSSLGYLRNEAVRSFVRRRSGGKCEYCGKIDFLLPDGSGYLETHHVISLAKQGPDTPKNVIGLCSGHHREAHYGIDREHLERGFLRKLRQLG